MKHLLLPLIIALAAPAAQPDNDVLFAAMTDELARSVGQLKLEKHDKPYYVSYRIDDTAELVVSASFGASTTDRLSRQRFLHVDVHVGDYKLDSGNMRRSYWEIGPESGSLSLDDDYDAIRHALWLETDSAYKDAVESLEKKKALLQQRNVVERPDDWSKEEALVLIEPRGELNQDRNAWKTRVKDLSSLFKGYPKIRQSNVSWKHLINNRYFVNSEGSKSRVCEQNCVLTATGTAQSTAGMKATDSVVIAAIDEQHMPSIDTMESKIKQMAQRLTQTVEAKECEMYQGPVMFEGAAAAEFFNRTLASNVLVKRPHDDDRISEDPVQARIGRRILPPFINVVDDPGLKDETGTKLVGCSDVDGQGVHAQRVVLVEKGIFKALLCTRLPTLKFKNSNGHALSGSSQARISNLVVQADSTLDPAGMKAKLLELGKEDALDYVLVVHKLSPAPMLELPYEFSFDEEGMITNETGKGRIDLPSAIDCTRLYLADGHEEPVRGAEFSTNTLHVLRDIVAAGSDAQTYSQSDGYTTITAPSVILRDVEVQKSHANTDKPPVLPHPYFEKQGSN